MLPRSDLAVLRAHVRDEIGLYLEAGGGRAREIARDVCQKHGALVGALGGQLAENAVTAMVAREIKRWSAVGAAAREQLALPGMAAHVASDLPASISVPGPDGDSDPIYRPLFGRNCASIGELRAVIAALWKSIADDRRKAEALNDLLELAASGGAGDRMRVSDALRQVATT